MCVIEFCDNKSFLVFIVIDFYLKYFFLSNIFELLIKKMFFFLVKFLVKNFDWNLFVVKGKMFCFV